MVTVGIQDTDTLLIHINPIMSLQIVGNITEIASIVNGGFMHPMLRELPLILETSRAMIFMIV